MSVCYRVFRYECNDQDFTTEESTVYSEGRTLVKSCHPSDTSTELKPNLGLIRLKNQQSFSYTATVASFCLFIEIDSFIKARVPFE